MPTDAYGYSTKPRAISDEVWFYEDRRGLRVVQELRRYGKHVGMAVVTIPWSKVCRAVDHHRKIKASSIKRRHE